LRPRGSSKGRNSRGTCCNTSNGGAARTSSRNAHTWHRAVTDTDEQLIDVHAHFLTDAYVIAARAAGHVHPDGMAGWPNWSAEARRWSLSTFLLAGSID
jgi:hypothetical protein